MSRARHKARATGGKVAVYAGENSNVMKEAHELKRGGRVHHEGEGEKPKHHAGKRARGGKVKHEEMHEEGRKHGGHVRHRARGGAVGSDKRPLSSASKITEVKGEMKREGE